jgi:hypothetical protein
MADKIIVANTASNTAGSYFQPVVLSSVGAGNTTLMTSSVVIPVGDYMTPGNANVTIEINAYTGTANAWTTVLGNGVGGYITSDGYNVRANATTGTQSITLYAINKGNAASQTYVS